MDAMMGMNGNFSTRPIDLTWTLPPKAALIRIQRDSMTQLQGMGIL
jgi:hypothetical protein